MTDRPRPGRRLIFMLSPEGKTDEELAHEAYEAYLKYQEAEAGGEEFQPVLDLKPTPPESGGAEA